MKKRFVALFLVVLLVLGIVPADVLATSTTGTNKAIINVEHKYAAVGATVDVNVSITGNPGIAGATFTLKYHEDLKLINAVSEGVFDNLDFTKPGVYSNPCNFTWDSENAEATGDGVFLKLTFEVSETVQENEKLNVDVSYRFGDVFNNDNDLNLDINNGDVTVIDYIPGDLFEDGVINSKDTRIIRQHIAGGYDIVINEAAADVNDDGMINSKDTRLIRRYIAGGYDVELVPSTPKCEHSLTETDAKAATCTEDGNSAYWYCSKCEKYYDDANGTREITLEDTVIKTNGHTVVIDPAVAPTYTSTGLTEGSHCSVCEEVFVKQEVVPALEGYSITYNITNGDTYLATQEIENPNQELYSSYTPESNTIVLKNLQSPAGYKFMGWFDGESTNANKITEIPKGSARDWELYAHWEKEVYSITYASDMVPVDEDTYTTDKGKELPSPKIDKYTFVGWSDRDGKIWTSIPIGTTGNITLYANWSSNRNRAKAVANLDDPIIIEDSEEGLMLFTYEIGTIENIPLFTTLNLNCVNGIITEVSRTDETSISTTRAEEVAEIISNATTNSASWTLSKNWNSTTEVSQSYLDQSQQTREEAEILAKSTTNTYNLSTSLGASNTNTESAAGSFKLSGNQSHSTTNTTESGQNFDLSVDAKYSRENSAGISLGIPIEGLDLGIEAGTKSTFEIGAGVDYGNYVKNTKSGTDSWSNSSEIAGEKSNSQTSTKTWNTSEGYSNSNSTSMSTSVSNTISKLISQQYGYGESYSEGGINSEAQELATTDSKSNEFSTAMTYYSSEIKSTTTTYSSTGNTKGDYRLVMAGKVHVFAVVGYNVADSSYFVYTYNVLDDKTEEYLDYSYDGSFDDYETSIIPFEVPGFVNDYVNNRIAKTAGLRIDSDTGIIEKDDEYESTEEPVTIVSVPSYVSVDLGDDNYKSVKVTGITSDLFKGNTDVVGIILGHHIHEIPDNAFEGCTSLKYVIAPGVTKIGKNAFSGCTSLDKFTVSSDITDVGENAFENVPAISVTASSALVAETIASSGADSIVLDISVIPEEEKDDLTFEVGNIQRFELQGRDCEYKNLRVKSDAETTVINGVKIIEGNRIPLEISSPNVTLNRVTVNSSGYAMLLTADSTNIALSGTVSMSTESGNTVVCKDIKLSLLNSTVSGKLTVAEKLLICGTVEGDKYLNCDNIIVIDEETYNQYRQGVFNINFNANSGTVGTASKQVLFGTAIGDLPTPTRDYYTFNGWFTAPDGGTQITAETAMTNAEDLTVYAHWTLNPVSGWVKSSELPGGAQVTNTKYSYNLTSYTTSSSSTLSGWTHYNTTSAWSDYGAWSGWSKTAVSGSDSRQVETKTVTDKAGFTQYRYWRYVNSAGTAAGTQGWNGCTIYQEIYIDHALSVTDSSKGLYGPALYNGGYSGLKNVWFFGNTGWIPAVTHKEYRYRDRHLVYTYYFSKTDSLESASYPSGTNISNIQEWVQYRAK